MDLNKSLLGEIISKQTANCSLHTKYCLVSGGLWHKINVHEKHHSLTQYSYTVHRLYKCVYKGCIYGSGYLTWKVPSQQVIQPVLLQSYCISLKSATTRFYFKVLFDAGTIWGWLHFEIGIYARTYAASIISLFVCTYNVGAHTHIVVDPVQCGEIFGGWCLLGWVGWNMWQDFEVQWDFEEIQYEYKHH